MTEAEWLACADVEQLLTFLRDGSVRAKLLIAFSNKGRIERKQRLFLIACCRRIWDRMPDAKSCRAVDVAEEYVDNQAKRTHLEAAHAAAKDVSERVPSESNYPGYCAACAAAEVSWPDFQVGFDRCIYGSTLAIGAFTDHRARVGVVARDEAASIANRQQVAILRDVFGNPFRPVALLPEWRTGNAVAIAQGMYESRDFTAMPILADALQDAGCDNETVLAHCRDTRQVHVRGCWALDLVLGNG